MVRRVVNEEELAERRRAFTSLMEDDRDKHLENRLDKVAKKICDDEGIPPPEIVVVPKDIVIQVSDGATDLASYRNFEQTIYTEPDLTLFDLCHEISHHRDEIKMGKDALKEYMECARKGIPERECPYERRANEFAFKCMFDYRDDWKEEFGERKIYHMKS